MDYKDKRWKRKRLAILRRDGYQCQESKRYGKTEPATMVHHIFPVEQYPELAYVDNNLISFSDSKHNTMHDRDTHEVTDKGKYWQNKVKDLLGVEDYNIIDKFKVIVIWGAPGSGKTTYAKNYMKNDDMIVDLDNIKQAISTQGKSDSMTNLLGVALKIRSHVYDMIDKREVIQANTVWVVTSLPKHTDREYIKGKLRPNEMIHINTSKEDCIKNVLADKERTNKNIQIDIIEKYFKEYSIAPHQ